MRPDRGAISPCRPLFPRGYREKQTRFSRAFAVAFLVKSGRATHFRRFTGEHEMRSIEIQQENAESEILEFLAENEGYLEGPSQGIARQAVSKGMESLTRKQQYIFDRFIAGKFFHLECSRCHIPMPSSEVIPSLMEQDNLCAWCRNVKEKYY